MANNTPTVHHLVDSTQTVLRLIDGFQPATTHSFFSLL
jgi:hypothetical protein